MYDPDIHPDPIGPAGAAMLAEAGIDCRVARETIAGDRALRCADRDTVLRGGAGAIRDTAMAFEEALHEAAAAEPFLRHPSRRPAR